MPYEIRDSTAGFVVVNSDTGQSMGTHARREDAESQVAALYASVPDVKRVPCEPLKAVKQDDGRIKVEGYLLRYTDPARRDLTGEYWTKATYLMREAGYPIVGAPIKYQHAMEKSFGEVGIGVLDFVDDDDVGVFVRGQLKNRTDYEKMIEEINQRRKLGLSREQVARKADLAYKAVVTLVDEVPLQWSMGAYPQTYKVAPSGQIEQAGIVEATLTPTPAEPNGTQVKTFKSILELLIEADTAPREAAAKSDADAAPRANFTHKMSPARGGTLMDLKDRIMAALEAVFEEADKMAMPDDEKMMPSDDEKLAARDAVVEKAAGEYAKQEETMKAVGVADVDTDALVKQLVTQNLEAYVQDYVKSSMDAVNARRERIAKAAQAASANAKASAPAKSVRESAGAVSTAPRVSVSESLKYAHMSDSELALAVKFAAAAYPEHQQKRMKMGDLEGVLSEDLIRTAAHRVSKAIDRAELSGRVSDMESADFHAMKSVRPFKADELNATDITGQGLEWLSVWYDTRLWERARNETRLFDHLIEKGMRTATIPQGSKTMNVKTNTGSGSVYTSPEANSVDAVGRPETVARLTPFTTGEVEVSAAKHIIAQGITYDLEEDSIINAVAFANDDMRRTLNEAIESVLLNGDTATAASTNINLIDGTPAGGMSTPDYIAWDGFRKHALVTYAATQAADAGGVMDITLFNQVLSLFPNAIKQRKDNMLFVIDSDTEDALRVLPELLTMDTAGGRATIFTGDLNDNPLFRVMLYTSGFLNLANTAGKISGTSSNNTTGSILGIYAPYWQYGRKRAVTIESVRDPLSQTQVIVASVRHAFTARGANGANIIYNVGV